VRDKVDALLKQTFRPEFLNRVDEIIFFRGLSREDMSRILDIQLGYLRKRLEDRKVTIMLSEVAERKVADEGYDPAFGARPLKRAITRLIENPISLMLLEGKVPEGSTVKVDADKEGKLSFTVE